MNDIIYVHPNFLIGVDCKNLTEFFRLHPNLISRFSQYERMYWQIRADTIDEDDGL